MIPRARGGKKKDCFLGSGSEPTYPRRPVDTMQ